MSKRKKKGPGLGLEQTVNESLQLHSVGLNEIIRNLEKQNDLSPTDRDFSRIRKFLNYVNGKLVKKDYPYDGAVRDYVAAIAIYEFVGQLLGMDLTKERNDFTAAVKKEPYNMEMPFEIYLAGNAVNLQEEGIKFYRVSQVDLEGTDLSLKDRIKRILVEELNQITDQVNQGNRSKHDYFNFMAIYVFANHLFKFKLKEQRYETAMDSLTAHYGEITFRIPAFVREP